MSHFPIKKFVGWLLLLLTFFVVITLLVNMKNKKNQAELDAQVRELQENSPELSPEQETAVFESLINNEAERSPEVEAAALELLNS